MFHPNGGGGAAGAAAGGGAGGSSNNNDGMGTTTTTKAKRVITSILETSGLVCGSLRDTVQDTLDENDVVDMRWVNAEIDAIKSKLEKPRERLLSMTDKACRGGASSAGGAGGGGLRGGIGTGAASVGGGGGGLDHPPPSSFAPDAPTESFLSGTDGGGTQTNEDSRTFDDTLGTGTIDTRTLTVDTTMGGDDTLDLTADDDGESLHAADEDDDDDDPAEDPKVSSRFASVIEDERKRERALADAAAAREAAGGADVVIGLCLSRKASSVGHPDTVTRQTAFDFNELQDRDYRYVSSTDESGWLAGGGERGDPYLSGGLPHDAVAQDPSGSGLSSSRSEDRCAGHKIAAPDRVHIPIMEIRASSSAEIDEIVSALARGEIFIPEVSVLPQTLTVNNKSPPDLQLTFGCEKNDDANPEDWPNWCLEFLHNQLYEYFAPTGHAVWSRRPFQITLARKVRWMTVKHMHKYFARSEQVTSSWREKGPRYLRPPHADESARGVILEEITRPHGVYLIRDGAPTNYFAPNFKPPYGSKMNRSLIRNVINKSWDAKRRDWRSEPLPRNVGPVHMISSALGCSNPGHMSPVAEEMTGGGGGNANVGAFHRRTDFDASATTRTHAREEQRQDGGRAATARKKGEGANGRSGSRRKDAPHQQSQQKDAFVYENGQEQHQRRRESPQRREPEETGAVASTTKVRAPSSCGAPSDEGGTAVRSTSGGSKLSLSLEEAITGQDPIIVNRQSASTESPERADRETPQDYQQQGLAERKASFNGGDRLISSHGSSNSSVAEQRVPRPRSMERQKVDPSEGSTKESPYKMDGQRRAEKYARTKSKRREMKDRRQDENGERSTPTSKASSSPTRRYSQPSSPSCESMAYSMDSMSQFRPPVLAGNGTNDGGSVYTLDNQSLLSYVTRSTMQQSGAQEEEEEERNSANVDDRDGEDDISLSLLESNSTIVPSDEDLRAVGWAKALDPNSGVHYYFTLDRTKTVWENPLATSP